MASKRFLELLDEAMSEINETMNHMDDDKEVAMEVANNVKIQFDAFMEFGFNRDEALKLVIAFMNI